MHALFSIGGMAGAFGGGQLARLGVSVNVHLACIAVVCALMALAVSRFMLPHDAEHDGSAAPHFSWPRRPVVALGALGFCMLLCEGAMADWIAIFLRDWLAAGPATAAAGFAVFSGAMSVGRLAGDRITDRFGGVATVRTGAILAAGALAVALLHGSIVGVLLGLTIVGLGYAAIIPNVFAASGRIPGVPSGAGIAAVTTMGYFGFLVGPPMIGWLAEWVGLRNALFTLVLLSGAGALLAGSLRRAGPLSQEVYEPDVHG
jgi:predicted MFS family arabinose efflux permease